jgi:PAS domain S-box-containing protein
LDREKPLLRILQRVPTPVVIANPVTGRVLWVNQRLAEMYGVSDPHQLIGKSLFDFIEAPQLSGALADLARVVAGKSPPPVTYQLKRASGEYAAGQVSSVPMAFQGQPAMLSFVTDVTERERMVRELTESEERYRALLETLPSGLVVVVDDSIVYANSALATALGYDDATSLVGQPMYAFVHEDFREPVREARRKMMQRSESYPASAVVLLRKDGSELATTAASAVIRWDGQLASQTLMYDVGLPG